MPETERLYFNTGASEDMMNVSYIYHDILFNLVLTWQEIYDCPRYCTDCEWFEDPLPDSNDCGEDGDSSCGDSEPGVRVQNCMYDGMEG